MREALALFALILATTSACPPGTKSYAEPSLDALLAPRLCGDVVGDCCPVTPNVIRVPKH